jgi:hypothetical protein
VPGSFFIEYLGERLDVGRIEGRISAADDVGVLG